MDKTKERTHPRLKPTFDSAAPAVGFDPLRYQHFLDDSTLSDEDKQELLKALWSIITNFVELGFGVHPIQQAIADVGACRKEKDNDSAMFARLLRSSEDKAEVQHGKA